MSTIKRAARSIVVVFGVTALVVGFGSAMAEAREATPAPVVWHLVPDMTSDHIAPILKVNTTVALKEAGWMLHNSDYRHPMVKAVKAGTAVEYPAKVMGCREAELVNPYAITAAGKMIIGASRSLYRSCLTHIGRYVNETCGPNQDKQLVRTVRVAKGNKINWSGKSHIALRSGEYLYAKAYINPNTPNIRTFYYFPAPGAQVDTVHLGQSTVFVSPNWGASVVSDTLSESCQD